MAEETKLTQSVWDDHAFLDACEDKRDKARQKLGRLTFDCFRAKARDADRVYCSMGFHLAGANDGTMFLPAILKGRTASQCRDCKEFDGGE